MMKSRALPVVLVLLLIMGTIFICTSLPELKAAFGKPIPFNQLQQEQLQPNTPVTGELTAMLGRFKKEYVQHTRKERNRRKSTYTTVEMYYILPIGQGNVIALHSSEETAEEFDELSNQTLSYLMEGGPAVTKTVPFTGVLKELDDTTYQELLSAVKEKLGAGNESLEEKVLPLILEKRHFTVVKVVFFTGVAFVLVGLLGLIVCVIADRKSAQNSRSFLESGG